MLAASGSVVPIISSRRRASSGRSRPSRIPIPSQWTSVDVRAAARSSSGSPASAASMAASSDGVSGRGSPASIGIQARVRPPRPRPATWSHAPSRHRPETTEPVARGEARTGHPVAQEQVIARSHDRGQARPRGLVDREAEILDERESRQLGRPARDLRGDRQEQLVDEAGADQAAEQPGPALADDEVEIAIGQRREDRVLLDPFVIAGDDDLDRRGELRCAGADAAPASVVSSTTGTSVARRPGCSGSIRPLALTMTVVGCGRRSPSCSRQAANAGADAGWTCPGVHTW